MALEFHNRVQGFDAIHPIMWIASSDPAGTPANDVQPFQWWLDTTSGATMDAGAVLRYRNSGNSAWTVVEDLKTELALYATLVSPTFTGTPAAPTATGGTNTTQLATTAFVQTAVGGAGAIPESLLTTLGDVIYASAASTAARLAGNTTATKKFLRQTGTGSASAAPAWDVVVENDVGASTNAAGNTSTAITIDWSVARAQSVTATGNFTLTHSNMISGLVYTLEVATGAGSFTGAFASTSFAGGSAPTLTVTASKTDVFTFYKTIGGTILGGIFGQAF